MKSQRGVSKKTKLNQASSNEVAWDWHSRELKLFRNLFIQASKKGWNFFFWSGLKLMTTWPKLFRSESFFGIIVKVSWSSSSRPDSVQRVVIERMHTGCPISICPEKNHFQEFHLSMSVRIGIFISFWDC